MNAENLAISDNTTVTASIINADNERCTKCGSYFFKEVYALKKLSSLLSPTGKDEIIPISIWVCDKCGEVASTVKNNKNYDKIIPKTKIEF